MGLAASHGDSLYLFAAHCIQRLVPTLLPIPNLCHASRQEVGHEEAPGQEGDQGETAGAEKKAAGGEGEVEAANQGRYQASQGDPDVRC